MLIYLVLSMFMFLSGLFVFSSKRKHLLLMLLSLEFILVALYMNLYFYLGCLDYEYFFSMVYLTMGVCEGALGLSVLVMMIRSHGNDYVLNFSSLW